MSPDWMNPDAKALMRGDDNDPYSVAPLPDLSSWRVTTRTNLHAIAAQSGVPVEALSQCVDSRTTLGYIVAETKGAAIIRAHELFPRVPVADLCVEFARAARASGSSDRE